MATSQHPIHYLAIPPSAFETVIENLAKAAWAIVDPVIHAPAPLFEYECGTWGPAEANRLVLDIGGWNTE